VEGQGDLDRIDGRMFAINKATGEVVWERKIADPALGETLTIAP
jgi:alcohol dehydrogenase (cytochrome c)